MAGRGAENPPFEIVMGEIMERRPHLGEQLNAQSNNATRARQCQIWAQNARDDYFQGMRDQVDRVLQSKAGQWVGYGIEARKQIGQRLWASSVQAKMLAGDEQMFSRWAQMFATLAQVDLQMYYSRRTEVLLGGILRTLQRKGSAGAIL